MKYEVNPDYQYFVYNIYTHSIVAGNEYREDAQDVCSELNEISYKPVTNKVYTAKHIMTRLNLNPYDFSCWSNPTK